MRSNVSSKKVPGKSPKIRPIPDHVRAALTEVKAGLENLYGDRLCGIYLYGSYARGDFRSDSDVDVMVVLAGTLKPGLEITRMNAVVAPICLHDDLVISILPVSHQSFANESEPLFRFVRQDAMKL